ncbi:MAG: hypothetical protein QXP96_00890 [Thermoproteota archaeon]
MGKLGFTYLEEEDTLILHPLEQGEATVVLPKTVLKILIEKTVEGFRISMRVAGEEKFLKMLILKDAGPAALRLTEDVATRLGCLRLSRDLKDLKIEGLKLSVGKLELDFITVPIKDF